MDGGNSIRRPGRLRSVEIDLHEAEDPIRADDGLARVLGWTRVLTDDDAQPYELNGLVEKDGEIYAVFSFSRNLAIGDDYEYSAGLRLSADQATAVRGWVNSYLEARAAAKAKNALIEDLLREHGLDGAIVQARREELLRKHGLL